MDKNKCPTCKQDIECNKSFQDEDNAEDDHNENDIVINSSNVDYISILCLFLWVIIIIFMFKGFCLRIYSVC